MAKPKRTLLKAQRAAVSSLATGANFAGQVGKLAAKILAALAQFVTIGTGLPQVMSASASHANRVVPGSPPALRKPWDNKIISRSQRQEMGQDLSVAASAEIGPARTIKKQG